MKYNLIQIRHDKIVDLFLESKIDKNAYFEFEQIIEDQKELYSVCLN